MSTSFLTSPGTSWFALDGDVGAVEAIAIIGAVVWGGAVVWMAVADVRRYRSHHGRHRARTGLDRETHR